MCKSRLMAMAFSMAAALNVSADWKCSDSALIYTENDSEYWKLAVSVADKAITLTSMESTPTSGKSLDLTGALESYGIADSGYSLTFAEGEGLSVLGSVEHLTVTGNWFSLMPTDGGKVFTKLKSVKLGTEGVDLQLGDTEIVKGNPVFNSSSTLTDILVIGRNLTLKAAFITHAKLTDVCIRASGSLTLSYTAFWGGNNKNYYSIRHAELVSGGDMTIGNSSLRGMIAEGGQIYIEAPASSKLTLDASAFQNNVSHPFKLYWNAPCPNDAKNAFLYASFDWYICNSPEIVDTFPKMDGENYKSLGSYTSLFLPEDPSDLSTEGGWKINYGGGENSGSAKWSAEVSTITAGTNGWSFNRETSRLIQKDAQGSIRWEMGAYIILNRVVLSPLTSEAPSDGILSLAGADLGLKWSDVNLSFAEGTGAFSGVKKLNLAGLPWLRQMNRQSAAAFTSLLDFSVGTPENDLILGDSLVESANIIYTESVFPEGASLTNILVYGKNVTLNNAFHGQFNIKKAVVHAHCDLLVGPRSFYAAKNGGRIERAEFVSGGNLTFAVRSLFRGIGKDAQIFVVAPVSSHVECGEWMFYDNDGLNRPFSLYWNAPAPDIHQNAMHHVDFTWYVYNDSDATKTFLDSTGVKKLGEYVSISLPQDRFSRTLGKWKYGEDGTEYTAKWYGRRPGTVVSFR